MTAYDHLEIDYALSDAGDSCDDGPGPLIWTPSPKPGEVEQRSPFAVAMQGAWGKGAYTACPVGPYGHLCDPNEYKTVCTLGFMSPCDVRPDFMWDPDRCKSCGAIHKYRPDVAATCALR